MKPRTYDFRQFQDELAALDRNGDKSTEAPRTGENTSGRMLEAKEEFNALRGRYGLTIADVVTFFPEEEGIAYLQGLIADLGTKPKSRRTRPK